jgi:hypothetical protein
MKDTNMKAMSLALLALAAHSAANAGAFVDERTHAPAAAAPVVAMAAEALPAAPASAPTLKLVPAMFAKGRVEGRVTGALSDASWQTPAPRAKEDFVPLATAIMELRPQGLPAIEINAPDDATLDTPVTWTTNGSRLGAMSQIAARYGVNFAFEDAALTVRLSDALPTDKPNAIAALPKRAFEVRLNDIRLATAFERWARDSGERIRWDADKHLLIEAPMTFMATDAFDAITQALSTPGILNSEYPLEVCEYPNTPTLLRVTRQGEQAKDCPV